MVDIKLIPAKSVLQFSETARQQTNGDESPHLPTQVFHETPTSPMLILYSVRARQAWVTRKDSHDAGEVCFADDSIPLTAQLCGETKTIP